MASGQKVDLEKTDINFSIAIKGKLEIRIKGMSNSYLSRMGREVLIKYVAHSNPSYIISVFKMPKKLGDKIQSLISSFWWGKRDERRRIHWCQWIKLYKPRRVGILDLRIWKILTWIFAECDKEDTEQDIEEKVCQF
ncbi:hypothetical protein V2J09_016454 [Rumex salicifolius]